MHKRYVNQCTLELTIIPDGPILIKSGQEGADPTKPDMEFVETYHKTGKTIYLPGSGLKGAIRAHAERIVRTVGKDKRPNNPNELWANDPLNDDYKYLYVEKTSGDNQKYVEKKTSSEIYRLSSFTDQMFGNTAIASRLRIEDAYPDNPKLLKIEERNGVAIDRVYGSVAVGPFNYQVCTAGEFKTKIHLKNFTLAQLGLIALVLRDLNEGWFGIGFAKSRGLGTVEVDYTKAIVQYPGCQLKDDKISLLGSDKTWETNMLLGAGEFLDPQDAESYGFPREDRQQTPIGAQSMDFDMGVQLIWQDCTQVKDLFVKAVKAWKNKVEAVVV